uniref:cystathionine gamma-lyase n=1 Tax=Halisarca dujardinii TaxID=2583056 RepID=A0A6C0PMZ2_HALDU|nr:cystathionine gamma-lyase-like protein [Halisarca dujardinii]
MATFPHFGTDAIHAGQDCKQWKSKAVIPGIFLSTTYQQDVPGQPDLYEYTRGGNPTRTVLQSCVAALENAKHGLVAASGLAATSMVLQMLSAGDHIVSVNDVYGGTNRFFRKVLSKYNIECSLVDATNAENVEKAITDKTKVVWVESSTNPTLQCIDIQAVANTVHKHKDVILVVDNTFMTPYFLRPLDLGADVVLHSATKYLNGHTDVLMGVLCTNSDSIADKLTFYQYAVGAVPSPFDCYMVNRGLKTLHVRMRMHQENAMAVAKFLETSPHVVKVLYPGLPSHPTHEVAKRQCKGYSGMVSFVLKGDLSNVTKFSQSTKVFILAESLGGYESLIDVPSVMTHASVPAEEREQLGIKDTLVRLSVGLEECGDLVEDLRQALEAASSA